jgi:microcompartment protein CcmK/EutM
LVVVAVVEPTKTMVLLQSQLLLLLVAVVVVDLDHRNMQVAVDKVGANQDKLTLVAAEAADGIMVLVMVKVLLVVLASFVFVIQSNICFTM